jgi:hypothetical protein
MIIYGTNGAHVRTAQLPGVACPGCDTSDTLHLSVFSRYAHIYWIPLFPYSKPTVTQCSHCQQAWEEKTIPSELRNLAQTLKKETRAPLLHWAGLAIVAALIGWGAVAGMWDGRENKSFLAAPRVGDIYTVRAKAGDKDYSLLKVVGVKGPTVDVVSNEFTVNSSHPIEKLNTPDKYNKESFSLSNFELQIMQNKGQLTDVDRPGE